MTKRYRVKAGCTYNGRTATLRAGELVPVDEPSVNVERQLDRLEPADEPELEPHPETTETDE